MALLGSHEVRGSDPHRDVSFSSHSQLLVQALKIQKVALTKLGVFRQVQLREIEQPPLKRK